MMAKAAVLSEKDVQDIVAARETDSVAEIRRKYGIGTTRLYKIWRDAGVEIEPPIIPQPSPPPSPPPKRLPPPPPNPVEQEEQLGQFAKEMKELSFKIKRLERQIAAMKEDGEVAIENQFEIHKAVEEGAATFAKITESTEQALATAKQAMDATEQAVSLAWKLAAVGGGALLFWKIYEKREEIRKIGEAAQARLNSRTKGLDD